MKTLLRILGLMVGCLLVAAPAFAHLVISEFRLRGAGGLNDEYVEIMNNSGAAHTVAATSGTGYGLAASDGNVRCTILNGTVIPARGRFLCVNSIGYALAGYPAGSGTTAMGNATYTTDIPDNAGIALFNNNTGGAGFTLANRLDAVGSTAEANALYREGAGYPSITPFSVDYAWIRDQCGKQGSTTAAGLCPTGGRVVDTNDNAVDFYFIDPDATSVGAGQRLGAPGPENSTSPRVGTKLMPATVLDPCGAAGTPPNAVRDLTSDPANNSTFGTVDLRATFTNTTGGSITRLRFRVVDLSTFPTPAGVADLRPRTVGAVVVTVDRPPCGVSTSNVTVLGTTLEQPPSQPNGGGFNSSLSVGVVTLATPLANGNSIDVRVLLGVQEQGAFRVGLVLETLPVGVGTLVEYAGCTDNSCSTTMSVRITPPLARDFNLSGTADLLWRNANTGVVSIWFMNGTNFGSSGSPGSATTDWSILGVGDFNRDGKADILWRNATSGQVFIWLLNGASVIGSASLGTVSADWTVAGVRDFNGDGRADILWRNTTSGQVFLWFMNGLIVSSTGALGVVALDWVVAGVGDFNGDVWADILWRNTNTGQVFVWLLNGTSFIGTGSLGIIANVWAIVGIGDFDADGRSDILWRHTTTGQVFIWLLNGDSVSATGSPGTAGTDWVIARVSDFNGDGKDDLVWRHTPSGQTHIWLLNGTSFAASGSLGVVTADWVVQ